MQLRGTQTVEQAGTQELTDKRVESPSPTASRGAADQAGVLGPIEADGDLPY